MGPGVHQTRRWPYPARKARVLALAPTEPAHSPLRRGRRIGILGGSFNPAHVGHMSLTLEALRRLRLDQVWWLVSPQNPLKPKAGMSEFGERLRGARALARHPRIRVSDLEAKLGTRYTADTLAALRRRFPRLAFVWLMGADNLIQIPAWQRWGQIFRLVPVAVFARPTYCLGALAAKAARRFAGSRMPEAMASRLATRQPPAWVFVHGRLDPASATAIRAERTGKTKKAKTGTRQEPKVQPAKDDSHRS
jgi:nicotinate-nucleotide adenylyltransferase